jgi:hypothetical protein
MTPATLTRFDRIRLAVLAADPALSALRLSGCIVVAMAGVCGILMLIGHWYPLPRPAFVLALIATMQGSLQIHDRTASGQAATRLYAGTAAFAAVALISAVHGSLHQINVALVIIVFIATYVARFGVRWRAVGMFTVMCAVVAAYLKEDERDLRTVAAALIVSGIVVHVVQNMLTPSRPERDFRRLVSTVLSVSGKLRSIVGVAPLEEGMTEREKRRRHEDLRLAGGALTADIRTCEAALPLDAPGQDAGETGVALKLLDLQLAAETLLALTGPHGDAAGQPATDRIERAVQDLRDAEEALETAVTALPVNFPSAAAGASPAQAAPFFPKRGEWLQDRMLRQSLQVTLACAIAASLGEAISTQRWFWAVISAFMIFNNAQSGQAVAVRGLDRAWGTALGIVIGITLATLTHDHLVWLGVSLAFSVFMTFFIARVSYIAMSLFLTISLSLIYGLIGIFTPELLVLRLEETAIGVGSGMLAALLLFPISIHQQVMKAMDGLLSSLGDLLQAIAEGRGIEDARALAQRAAATDRALGGVLTAIGPMRSNWAVGAMGTAGRDTLRTAYLMASAGHRLERRFREARPTEADAARLLALSRRLRKVAGKEVADNPTGGARVDTMPGVTPEPDDIVGRSVGILSRMLDSIEAARRPGGKPHDPLASASAVRSQARSRR